MSDVCVASFPVPRPAFRRLQYGKAGRGTGNEASVCVHMGVEEKGVVLVTV